jgi:hypothetical protein
MFDVGDLPRRRLANAGAAFSLHPSESTCGKVGRPHFLKKFLKLFRSDLERTGKDATLSKKPINL